MHTLNIKTYLQIIHTGQHAKTAIIAVCSNLSNRIVYYYYCNSVCCDS